MGEHGTKEVIARNAIPVHGPEDFDPRAAGRELALEDKQKLKE